MSLTNIERETIICFNEAEKTAEVFTYRQSLIRQLDGLTEERPTEAMRVKTNAEGGVTFIVPKAWIKVKPKRVMSEAQKEAAAKAIAKAHSMR